MKSFQIRQKFLEFFEKNGHTIVPGSSLIPAQDPTLLFVNAGMNQFKDIFLGKEKRSYTRATSSQKCMRAGGKHNDLDQVGLTARHCTFFEMLGNFSFGDYFKKEAIQFAWTFLTKEIGIPAEKLFVTVFQKDDDAYDLWHKVIGLEKDRITRLGEKDNFWQMGDTGPCGPCSEIYFDLGEAVGCKSKTCAPGCDCPRFIEIWNLVFMQYNRQTDGTLSPLKSTGVDTGMGLERLCLVLQNAPTVFDTDLFAEIIKKTEQIVGINYESADDKIKIPFRVLAEHTRSVSLLIADGCSPSNDGRGYVLRKIIRRAALFAQKLSNDQSLLPQLAQTFINQMSVVYPELKTNGQLILNVLENEVARFHQNLITGQNILTEYIQELERDCIKTLTGPMVFKLYDTFGFPPELTALVANERGFNIDLNGFEDEMKKQQEQSCKKNKNNTTQLNLPQNLSTKFVGYEQLETHGTVSFVQACQDEAIIVVDVSPFYVECGGQIGDSGWVIINEHNYPVINLEKTEKSNDAAVLITIKANGKIKSPIKVGDKAHCVVDAEKRTNTENNHTAAHLLQAALIQILGSHVKQAGSLVQDDYLRFDFTHHQALTETQIEQVENLVNQKIRENIKTNISNTTLQKAKESGALSFFGDKYNPENVRMVAISGISTELCGGTHVSSTGAIGIFKITGESALATGTRRIFATTGSNALKLFQQIYVTSKKISEDFKVKIEDTYLAIQKLQQSHQDDLSKIKALKKQILKTMIPSFKEQIIQTGTTPFLFLLLNETSIEEMRIIAQELEKMAPGVYFMISKDAPDRFAFFAYASKEFQQIAKLVELVKKLKDEFNIRGGGNMQMIQGGGQTVPANFKTWLEKCLLSNN